MMLVRFERVPGSTPPALRRALEAATPAWHEALGPRLVSMVLFGSVARGTARPTSDIDLIIVARDQPRSLTERARPLRHLWEQVRRAQQLAAVEWNLIVKTPEEARHHSPLYLDLVEEGIMLVDGDGFFQAILEAMRRRMHELGSRRVTLPDGSWYWDLKPGFRFGEVVTL